jgi:hypothetical protein
VWITVPAGRYRGVVTVRGLAAIDMYGLHGSALRRRIVVSEFVAGAVLLTALGIWLLWHASGAVGLASGAWMAGAGLNYVPLACYAVSLLRPGRLGAALAGVDVRPELRRYSVWQLWILVPLAMVAMSARDLARRP